MRGDPAPRTLNARARALAAVVVLLVGHIAPLAHAAWSDHLPAELLGAAITADCPLCEIAAARTSDAALQSTPCSLPATPGVLTPASVPSGLCIQDTQFGPYPIRGPPLHA